MALPIIPRDECNVRLLSGPAVVVGYGNQGRSHALNLRDSGAEIRIVQRAGARRDAALHDGFTPASVADAVRGARLIISGLPDDRAGDVFRDEILPHVRAGQALGFIHGFALHYGLVQPPAGVDAVLVAPKGQARAVRDEFVAGRGVMALVAVHADATGQARQTALAWADGIGASRVGVLETTVRDETETDLFGEQSVLCGGLASLIQAGFDTLVEAGYPEELAYFECCHEVKLIADLIHEHGIAAMRERISSTARYGDVTRGTRVIDARVRETMRSILDEIRSGQFAREFLTAPPVAADPRLRRLEAVGEALRRRMFTR